MLTIATEQAAYAVLSKARAKYGRRLLSRQFKELLTLPNISEVASYLKTNTHYAPVLQGVQESAVHRGNLERLLRYKLHNDLYQLSRFERSIGERFFLYLVTNWEIEELTDFFAFFSAGKPQEYLLTMSSSVNRLSPIDMVSLASATSFDECLLRLKDTPYAALLRGFAPESGQTNDLYLPAIEAALHKFRYRYCLDLFERQFSGEVKTDLIFLLNMRAELKDVCTIVRSKNFSGWSPGLIQSQMVGAKCLLPRDLMEELIAAPTGEEAMTLFLTSPYRKFLKRRYIADYSYIDDLTTRILYDTASKHMHVSIHAPVVMFCLSVCYDVELENVTNIIEGVRYGVHPDSIERLLILEKGG